ncbi:MAG: DUF6541 family protein [Janthinobacterium lividum]
MTWADVVPTQLLGVAVVFVPGLLLGACLRFRGIVLPAVAPALSVAIIGIAALAAPVVGLSWGVLPVLVVTFASCLLAGVASRVLDRFLPDRLPPDRVPPDRPPVPEQRPREGPTLLAGLTGVLVAAVLAMLSVRRGLGRPDMVSQTWDALFQLNAVRWILDTGDASPLHVQRMTSPDAAGFYPAAWHGLTALIAHFGASPVVSANAVVWVLAGFVWPLGCAGLVRALVGPKAPAVFAAAVLSQGFVAFPWLIDRWGVLWPQALGTALVAPTLALLVVAFLPGAALVDRARALLGAVVATVGAALAHPGAVFLLAPLAGALLLVSALPTAVIPWRRRRAQVVAVVVSALAVLGAVGALVVAWPHLASVRRFDWPATRSLGQAVFEDVLAAPAGAGGSLAVAVLVLIGAVVAARSTRWRWLLVGHVLLVGLDVVAAGTDAALSRQLTGFWYNDRFRLASAVPLTGSALAVLGVCTLGGLLARRRLRVALVTITALLIAVPQVRGNASQLGLTNARAAEVAPVSFVAQDEQRFLESLRRYVPDGDVVAGTPWDGSSFAYALSGVPVLFPHFSGDYPAAAFVIADHLQDIATDPAVCAALAATRVRFVLDDGPIWDPPILVPGGFPGFRPLAGLPGFVPVASGGGATLYRIQTCDAQFAAVR